MRYRRLGSTGCKISEIVLGTATFGESVDESSAKDIVAAALDVGVSTFDTADIYNAGVSEELLGRAIAHRREAVVICTKVGGRVGDSEADHVAHRSGTLDHAARWQRGIAPTDVGSSRRHIIEAVEASLRRLGTDHIDLYQLHRVDPDCPIEETLHALDDLVHAGKVRYIGCSGFAAWQLVQALWVSDRDRVASFVSIQVPLNPLVAAGQAELLGACASLGVGVLAFQTLGGGVFTGRYGLGEQLDPGSRLGSRSVYARRYHTDSAHSVARRLAELAPHLDRLPVELAVGWALSRPGISGVLCGVSNRSQLDAVAKLSTRPLGGHEVAAIDAVLAPPEEPVPVQGGLR